MNPRLLSGLFALAALAAEPGWWMREPIRWLQNNLRETDAALEPRTVAAEADAFHANVLHLGMGGIVAFYPTEVPFHYPSPHMPAGRDFFGEALREAHARHIRVVGRFDFSKTAKPVFDAHPEWFFRKANGEPVIYNGLYSTCINGGYYREHAMKILSEALDRYPVDGLFFNMFGNQSTDYSGNFTGHCHCGSCRRRYRELYGTDLPAAPDDQYREFMARSSREVSAAIGKLIRSKRPQTGYFNYITAETDGIMSESNTAVTRPLPLWPYSASDNVDRARNSEPEKMAVNLNMQFIDFAWRFATVPAGEIALRLWQSAAHGGAAALAVNGTLRQQDRQAVETARPIFAWLAKNQQYYSGQHNAARVLLLLNRGANQQAYRGLFRFLTEEHIPFAVSTNLDKRDYDLVISVDGGPPELANIKTPVLIVGARPPSFAVAPIVRTWKDVRGYMRVRSPGAFPSLQQTELLMLHGDYTEADAPGGTLTLVPPSMFGPPEKIHVDMADTDKPGIVTAQGGRIVWIPWDASALYYRHSLPAHAGLLRDSIVRLLKGKRQLTTDAHPLVEITVMKQGPRTLVHLINLSGHSQTAYFAPIPMHGIRLDLAGPRPRTARAIRSNVRLDPAALVLPELHDYELIVLE